MKGESKKKEGGKESKMRREGEEREREIVRVEIERKITTKKKKER
jgi:hypothetical protein